MNTRPLGNTGLSVSEIGLGAAQIGNRRLPEAQAEAVLRTALDVGINFIDTAAMYGVSEERIGRYLSNRREDFVVATKCGDRQVKEAGDWKVVKDYSPGGILETIDESRRRLQTLVRKHSKWRIKKVKALAAMVATPIPRGSESRPMEEKRSPLVQYSFVKEAHPSSQDLMLAKVRTTLFLHLQME